MKNEVKQAIVESTVYALGCLLQSVGSQILTIVNKERNERCKEDLKSLNILLSKPITMQDIQPVDKTLIYKGDVNK